MYHNIQPFAENVAERKHLELYFYDDDPSLEHRYCHCREEMYEEDKQVIGILADVLRDNEYSKKFRSLQQEYDLDEYRILFNLDQRLDQRTYNTPLMVTCANSFNCS